MDNQTAARWVVETCETYKAQHGRYPTEIKVNEEIWDAFHGKARQKITFPLLTNTPNPADFDIAPTLPLTEIPLVTLTKQS